MFEVLTGAEVFASWLGYVYMKEWKSSLLMWTAVKTITGQSTEVEM